MAKKLGKSAFPTDHTAEDFQCFGPPALEDGEFKTCKIADLGSFSQDDKDSNKYYHAAVIKSKKTGVFYCYFEWGRVGAKTPQFQFTECNSEDEAQREFASQLHDKNDKRGVWTTVAGIRTLTAKPGKDVYLVRQLTTRSTGLPDAKTIKYVDPSMPIQTNIVKKTNHRQIDQHTESLLQDLIGGTIKYTRSVMADSSLPTQNAINQARTILQEAQKRVVVVGSNIDEQIADKDLRTFSGELYRRIPKIKAVNTPDSEWILSTNNIFSWQQDLDAFESALSSQNNFEADNHDPYHGLPLNMEWVDPSSNLGKFLYYWWPKATANRHHHIRDMQIKNIWKIDRHGDEAMFNGKQQEIYNELQKSKICERPLFQPSERLDVDESQREVYVKSNTALLFHGTRSVNVKGILEKSLLLPKQLVGVAITGAMFGPGIYWADDWKKSAGYTSLNNSIWSKGSGSVAGRSAFMFAADVTLGQPHVAPHSHGYTQPPKNTHCVFGMGRNHNAKNNSGVENNEWIVFQSSQNRLRYLAEFAA
jgi:hypothetical protein